MMLTNNILYVPIGRKTFDLEAGEVYRAQSSEWLKNTCEKVVEP